MGAAVRTRPDNAHRLFEISVLIKGGDGILEIAGGLLFPLVQQRDLDTLVVFLTAHELSEDPGDWVANSLRRAVEHLSPDTRLFVGAYLVVHGLIKVFLVTYLLRGRLWAYPTALAFLAAFVLYQIYRFVHTHSIGLLALALLDVLIMFSIWYDYRRRTGALKRDDG